MRVIAINGSPRKNHNTAQLLQHALRGARSQGAATELIHLYDIDFKGCISCFGCKLKTNREPWKCVYRDALTPILEKIAVTDALFLGSPIYLAEVTGEMRSFIERLVFPCISYNETTATLRPRGINAGFFFTMGAPEPAAEIYDAVCKFNGQMLGRLGGSVEILKSADACQFDDYSQYATARFDPAHKRQVKETQFALDCQRAFELGKNAAILAR